MKPVAPVLALVLAFAAAPLAATTFVMVSDEALVDDTPVVVEARVLSGDPSPAPGIPSTDYLIEVDRVLKGAVPGSNLIVRVPGGIGPDGIGLRIWGAPRFGQDERVVLFLHPRHDGTFGVAHLMLGAFREARTAGEAVLVRNLAEAREVPAPGEAADDRARYRQPRSHEAFVQWISRRAEGVATAADYFVEPRPDGGPLAVAEPFSVFVDGMTGLELRWFQWDTSPLQAARWVVNENFQPGLSQSELLGAIGDGMAVWNNDPGSDVLYAFGNPNTTSTTKGLGDRPFEFDSINSFQFDDPHSDVEGTFSCPGGGVLAIGGPWYEEVPEPFEGQQWHRIVGGDIVSNDGVACFFNVANPRRLASELFGHELGHTLGLGHSCDEPGIPSCAGNPGLDAALMNPLLDRNANRGPDLAADDVAGIRYLYGNGQGAAPAAPSGLTAQLVDAATAMLTWQDNSNNETGFRVQQKVGNGGFLALPDLPPGTTSTLAGSLQPLTTYTWRVRALGGGNNNSGFSNQVMLTTPGGTPAAPSDLTATPSSATVIDLAWQDNSSNETGFEIEVSSPVEDFHTIMLLPAGTTAFSVGGRVTGRPYTFRVRARNTTGDSDPSNEASATTSANPTAPCVADADTLCLLGGRFRVEVEWRNQFNNGDNGIGAVQPSPVGGTQSGVFSFFDPSNVELITKVVDASSLPTNPAYWFFYGALSTVEYWITVTDTQSGDSNTYHNPPDELCGFPDTGAFPATAPASSPAAAPAMRAARLGGGSESAPAVALPAPGGTAPCVADATTLCLHGGRFEVKVDWTDPRTLNSGLGMAVPGTDRTGYFWFFNASNIELVMKILDATTLPDDNWWVFYGALSDVEYNIQIRDTVTGLQKPYHNEPLNFCGDADTSPGLPNQVP